MKGQSFPYYYLFVFACREKWVGGKGFEIWSFCTFKKYLNGTQKKKKKIELVIFMIFPAASIYSSCSIDVPLLGLTWSIHRVHWIT